MLWFEDETKSYFAFLNYVGFTPHEVAPSIIQLFDQNRMYAVMTICFANHGFVRLFMNTIIYPTEMKVWGGGGCRFLLSVLPWGLKSRFTQHIPYK